MDFQTKMRVLIQLALIDNNLSPLEKKMIYSLGNAHGVPEEEIDTIFDDMLSKKTHELPPLNDLSDEGKFEYLFLLIQLMKVDKQVYLSEIRFCEDLAQRLGYKKQVVSALSSKIFSDPTILTDRRILLSMVKKYEAK